VIELGVLKGDNAEDIYKALTPSVLVLVDAWLSAVMKSDDDTNAHRPWFKSVDIYQDYFGGSIKEQKTFDNLYQQVISRFVSNSSVQIIRKNTQAARLDIAKMCETKGRFDLIYIDANHQFESVFDDLVFYKDFVAQNGVIQLNDCCHSAAGVAQNLGVLEAVVKFVKVTDYIPLILTNSNWSDVVLARRGSQIAYGLNRAIEQSVIRYVEVPHQLLGAARLVGGRPNISFV